MSKRLALSLVMVAVALLVSSAAFAEGPASPISDEAFLASLQAPTAAAAPEVPALVGVPEPIPATWCSYSCRPCAGGKHKFCQECIDGTTSCGACTTACST